MIRPYVYIDNRERGEGKVAVSTTPPPILHPPSISLCNGVHRSNTHLSLLFFNIYKNDAFDTRKSETEVVDCFFVVVGCNVHTLVVVVVVVVNWWLGGLVWSE